MHTSVDTKYCPLSHVKVVGSGTGGETFGGNVLPEGDVEGWGFTLGWQTKTLPPKLTF